MTPKHSVSSNNWFKSHFNGKSFNMFLTEAVKSNSASVSVARVLSTYTGDVNSALGETSKEPSSSTMSTEASFNNAFSEETLNLN